MPATSVRVRQKRAPEQSRVRDAATCITRWCAWPSRVPTPPAPGNVANVAKPLIGADDLLTPRSSMVILFQAVLIPNP
ncbi:hypothetical protein TYRP_017215 [Tyrophagus putrescentiae]|nr:hypothetical protein TYRP_017215 [Tyrophagus putrescentiae]